MPCRAGMARSRAAPVPRGSERAGNGSGIRDVNRDVPARVFTGWPAMAREDGDRDVPFVSPPGFVSPMAPLMKPHVAEQPRPTPNQAC